MYTLLIAYIIVFVQVCAIPIEIPQQKSDEYICIPRSSRFWSHLYTSGILSACNSSSPVGFDIIPRWDINSTMTWLYSKNETFLRQKSTTSTEDNKDLSLRTAKYGFPANFSSEKENVFLKEKLVPIDEQCDISSLRAIIRYPFNSIDDMYARMICLDQYFLFHHDYLLHFNNIYLQMTRLIRSKLAAGNYFDLPGWMMVYTTDFGNFYREALLNYVIGDIGKVPFSWRLSLEHARKGDMIIPMNFALGMTAHIVRDLGVTLSNLEPIGINASTKKSDSDKVNGIIHNCSLELMTPLLNFYAPVVNITSLKKLLHVALDLVTDVLREIAWKDAVFIAHHPISKHKVINAMDFDAWLLEKALLTVAPLFKPLRNYERLFPFEQFCSIVPWGCAANHK